MNWKIKAHSLAVLSRLPAGRQMYHWLQRCAGTNKLQVERDLGRAYELVEMIHESGRFIEGAECLEIGTGWHPFVPMVLSLAGAKRVTTIDVNPWLTEAYVRATWSSLRDHIPEIAARCGLPEIEIRHRYGAGSKASTGLQEFLKRLRIEYRYPGDARVTGFPKDSVDVVVSSNVLEHIPRELQVEIHAETRRILRPGGVAAHRFNPQDHFATVDKTITHANFLQYTSEEWHWYGGSGLAYHNRLRAPDYRNLFEAAGLKLEVCRERIDQRSLKAIESGDLKIADEFAVYSPEELAVDYMWIVCRKKTVTGGVAHETPMEPAHRETEESLV